MFGDGQNSSFLVITIIDDTIPEMDDSSSIQILSVNNGEIGDINSSKSIYEWRICNISLSLSLSLSQKLKLLSLPMMILLVYFTFLTHLYMSQWRR